MKIGLNATCLNNRPSGAKQRFFGVYNELFQHLEGHEFVVYEPDDCEIGRWFVGFDNVSFRKTNLPSESRFKKAFRGLTYWPHSLKRERFDIFEVFHLPAVKAPTGRTILTIHDIGPIKEDRGWLERSLHKKAFERSLKLADHLVTVSDTIKNEILDIYPDTPISVVYNGIDIVPYKNITKEDLDFVRSKFTLPEEYLLAVGHFRKRKNYARLVEAMAILHELGRGVHLVLVGNDSRDMNAIKQRIEVLGLSDHISILSGLADYEVRCIYKMCQLFVFPSAYEGFGIPILEAMAAGRPMVISDIPVFQEITQGKSSYFSHGEPDSIANAIDEVLTSSDEQDRLVRYGNQRVQDFSFKNIAINLGNIYKSRP
jgi:glycosyltransferase involved in cell wall biosynthesis